MPRVHLAQGAVDGLDLHYTSLGEGSTTALLIHGLGGFAESWRHTASALAPYSRVIAVDLPGFGQSAKPRAPYTLGFFAEAVGALLRALALERVSLVGHSLGAAVAVAFACRHPDRVDRLAILGGTVPGFSLEPSVVYRLLALPGFGEIASSCVTRGICAAALRRCFFSPSPEEIAFLVEHEYAIRTTRQGRAAYLATLRAVKEDFTVRAPGYRAALAQSGRPTLMIHGRQDRVVPLRHAETAARSIKGVQARWIDRCGHFPQIEHAVTVNDWLGEFLLASAGR